MGIKYKWLKSLVRERKISPLERMSSRVGYMGAGLLMAGQCTLEPVLFMIGFICVIIQVSVRKTVESCHIAIKWTYSMDYTFY